MSHEAIRGRHARVQAQLETFSKIGLVGNLAAMSTEDSALAARLTRIGLIDYRVNQTIGEDGRDHGWDAWKYIVYTDGSEKPLLCRTFGTEDEAWTMCERWKMADDRKRSSTGKSKLPKNIPANPETCSPVSNVDIEDSENAKLKVLMRLYPNLFASFDRISSATDRKEFETLKSEAEKAYLLDAATISGSVLAPFVPGDAQFILKLAAALVRSRKRKRSPKLLDLDFELAWGWIRLGYCFMSEKELAEAINAKLGTPYSRKQIAKRRTRGLRLMSKQPEGRKNRVL